MRLACKKVHTRRILTLFGELTVNRVGYGALGRASIHPLDAELGLPARAYSYEICRRLLKAAVCGPFDEATSFVAEMTGVVMPMRRAELVLKASVDFETFLCQPRPSDDQPRPRGDSRRRDRLQGHTHGETRGCPLLRQRKGRRPTRRR